MSIENEMKVLRKIVGKKKKDRITSQQIREYCGIQHINEQAKRRREWEEHVTKADAERLVKIASDNILYLLEKDLQDARKEVGPT